MINFKEVPFIDGNKEFYRNRLISIIVPKGVSSFTLPEKPSENSLIFSGDTSLFKKQVFSEDDLTLEGAYIIVQEDTDFIIKIHNDKKTSYKTYTYITYTSESISKIKGLYSVNYDKGIIYSSSSLKNIRISYKHSITYYEGTELNQIPASMYSINRSPTVNDNETTVTVYQIKDKTIDSTSLEYMETPILNLVTLEDNYEY